MYYPVFVVNLAHHPQRYHFMRTQLQALNLSPIRIEAFNGKDPASRKKAAAATYAPLTGGEIGCFESHRTIWKKIIDEDLAGAFVLEDDIAVASDFAKIDFPQDVLSHCDVVKIDNTDRSDAWYGMQAFPSGENHELRRLMGGEYSTACYFITNRGARKLYDASKNYFLPVDHFMFDQDSKTFWHLDVWKLYPAAATQLRFLQGKTDLPSEMQDSIQQNRQSLGVGGSGRNPWQKLTLLQKVQARLRRLMDMDTSAMRARRARENLAAFAKTQPVEQANVPFKSPSLEHVRKAELEAFGKGQAGQ